MACPIGAYLHGPAHIAQFVRPKKISFRIEKVKIAGCSRRSAIGNGHISSLCIYGCAVCAVQSCRGGAPELFSRGSLVGQEKTLPVAGLDLKSPTAEMREPSSQTATDRQAEHPASNTCQAGFSDGVDEAAKALISK
jgi:hypothetical protein